MQSEKKLLSISITTLLVLSMVLAAIPLSNAIPAPTLSASSGNVGDMITVSGTSTTPGGLIQVYWDSIKAWDGNAGFLAQGYAAGTSYLVTIVIPNATQGIHYVIIKEAESGEVSFTTFTVNSKIKLRPDTVLAGDEVTVVGTGFAESTSVVVLFDYSETPVTNEAVGTGDGLTKAFYLDHAPVKPGSITVKVDGTPVTPVTDYTLDHIAGIIYFKTAPAAGKAITADYTYYTATVTASASTDYVGFFTATFNVPIPASTGPVTALDSKGNLASATLTIVPQKITLTPTKGYRGTTVTVKGRGFTPGKTVDIRWIFPTTEFITVVDDYRVSSDGTFTATFTVPMVPDPTPPGTQYTVRAIESDTGFTADATFTVTAPPKITLSVTSGKANTIVMVAGEWFSPTSLVKFTFGDASLATIPSPVLTTALGYFTTSFKVPDVAAGKYTIKATDAKGLTATATFEVIVPITEIRTTATAYIQGDTISIYAKSTESLSGITLKITDPTGRTFWTYTITSGDVETIDTVNYLKWEKSVVSLPSDAPVGAWNFTAWSGPSKIATNLFTVTARTTIANVSNAISQLQKDVSQLNKTVTSTNNQLSQLQKDVSQLNKTVTSTNNQLSNIVSQISGVKSAADSAATAANAARSAVDAVASAANAAKSAADSAVSAANAAKSAADSAASSAKSAADTAQNAVSAANAAKSAADSAASSAAEAASSAEAAKAAAEGITLPVWIAVVLSLVAAIAAIFAIITIRGKIAG